MTNERSLEALTAEDFRDHQGARFRLSGMAKEAGSPGSFEAEIAEVTEHPAAAGTFRTLFSVVFHGPVDPVMPQGIYHVDHEHFGTLELFVVPLGPNSSPESGQAPTAMRYEAVFG